MWEHEIRAKSLEHSSAIVAMPKIARSHMQHGAHVTPETLRRAVIKVIGHVCNREACILEQPGGANEPRHGEIALRCRGTRTVEATHHGAREDAKLAGQHSYASCTRRAGKDRFEEAPAVRGSTRQVDGQLTEQVTLRAISISHQCATQFTPPGRASNIDEAANAALPERQHRVRRSHLQLAEKRNSWHAWKFPNERGDTRCV